MLPHEKLEVDRKALAYALGVRWTAGKILLERIVAMLSRMGTESPRRS